MAVRFCQVDERVAAMLEDAELVAQAEIDGAASELLRRKSGRDLDLSLLEVAVDVDVGENHSLDDTGGSRR